MSEYLIYFANLYQNGVDTVNRLFSRCSINNWIISLLIKIILILIKIILINYVNMGYKDIICKDNCMLYKKQKG